MTVCGRCEREYFTAKDVEALRAEVAALREAGQGMADSGWIPNGAESLARWREVVDSGAVPTTDRQGVGDPSGSGAGGPAAPETLAGVPKDDLYGSVDHGRLQVRKTDA